jgi:hypothetical protein
MIPLIFRTESLIPGTGPVDVTQVTPEAVLGATVGEVRATGVVFETVLEATGGGVKLSSLWLEVIRTYQCSDTPPGAVIPGAVERRRIRRLRRSPHLSAADVAVFYDALALDVETGIGLTEGQGSDPQIMLRWSDDGGHTWSDEVWVSAGARGQYQWQALWRRLGRSRDRVFEVSMSDPVRWTLLGAYLELSKGAH